MARRRRKGERLKRWVVCGLVVTVVLTIVLVKLDSALRPLIQNYGCQTVRRSAMIAVHQAVTNTLSQEPADYSQLITLSRGEDGRVLSSEANVSAINLLKSRIVGEISDRLKEVTDQRVRIPLGSLLGGSFFTGRGPYLPITVHSLGSVIATLSSSFESAGINQTCHRIYLNVEVAMTVVLPLERQWVTVSTDFLVCETLIVGEVPETFANLGVLGSEQKNFGEND